MVTPSNHVIVAQAGFTLSWTPVTLGISQYLLPAKYR